jgi:NAD(P)-dependent dehydrogenase (short-subunit alcohol dehydrogenase family)
MSHVIVVIEAGQIGQAIARRVGVGKRVLLADRSEANANAAAEVMGNAGYEVRVATVDVSSRQAVHALVEHASGMGDVVGLIHAAGVSPSQASPDTILHVDLYGTGYRRMIEGSVAKRAGTPDEVGAVGALLMGPDGGFITGSDFLMDGGVTAAYWYGDVAEVRAQ